MEKAAEVGLSLDRVVNRDAKTFLAFLAEHGKNVREEDDIRRYLQTLDSVLCDDEHRD